MRQDQRSRSSAWVRCTCRRFSRAIQVLNTEAPLPADSAAKSLADRGITTASFYPAVIEHAAEMFGYEAGFRVVRGDGVAYVYGPDEPAIGRILGIARREAGKVGVSNVEEVRKAPGSRPGEVSPT